MERRFGNPRSRCGDRPIPGAGSSLPTVSNQVQHNPEEIRDYFVAFLKKSPQGKIDEANVRILSDTHATNSGVLPSPLGMGPRSPRASAI